MKIPWRDKYTEEPPSINCLCEACGIEFFRPLCMSAKSRHIFCSRQCSGDYMNGKQNGRAARNICGHVSRKHFSKNLCYQCYRRFTRYGVTPDMFVQLYTKFGGRCHICKKAKQLHIDHCHNTGYVRGLLCNTCNLGVGFFSDSPSTLEVAISYIRAAQHAGGENK